MIIPLLFLATLSATFANNQTLQKRGYQLYHRHLSPSLPAAEWSTYGSLSLDASDSAVVPKVDLIKEATSGVLENEDGDGWYQLRLGDEDGFVTSVRACHARSSDGTLVIGLRPTGGVSSFSIDLGNVDPKGDCVDSGVSGSSVARAGFDGVRVLLPSVTKQINLAPPLAIDMSTGQPKVPEPEKSFLQKYWLPLLGVAFFLVSQMAPEPPAQGQQAAAK